MTQSPTRPPRLRLRLDFGALGAFGPGKADLLEGIAQTGSIAAAGRRMKMSSKRAWSLVETMNAMFDAPLVTSARGGARGGGAALTAEGEAVLTAYRQIEQISATMAAPQIARLSMSLAKGAGRDA